MELFNRTVKAARELLLAIHAQSRFQQGMYEPLGGRSPRMVRDGTSSTLTESPSSFETSMLLSVYRKPSWQAGTGVVTKHTEWVYADRPWRPSRANEDVEWALDALEAGSKAWDA